MYEMAGGLVWLGKQVCKKGRFDIQLGERFQREQSENFLLHPLEKMQYMDLIVTKTLLLKPDSISLIEKFFSEK